MINDIFGSDKKIGDSVPKNKIHKSPTLENQPIVEEFGESDYGSQSGNSIRSKTSVTGQDFQKDDKAH